MAQIKDRLKDLTLRFKKTYTPIPVSVERQRKVIEAAKKVSEEIQKEKAE